MTSLRSPLSQVKGTGSAGHGTGHFWHQRLTALALIPLTVWFCFSLASLPTMDYESVTTWLSSPFSAVLMICSLIGMFYHASLGLQMVLEDYIANQGIRAAALILVKLLCVLLAVSGIFSVLKIAL